MIVLTAIVKMCSISCFSCSWSRVKLFIKNLLKQPILSVTCNFAKTDDDFSRIRQNKSKQFFKEHFLLATSKNANSSPKHKS